ncbi:MAG TPA: tyrosinase family protein [Gammaproteobacteria bacterium]|nr:tyrosinase family protein [Gammaproteobacteria bacterium]
MIIRKSAFDKTETKSQQAFIKAVKQLNADEKYATHVNHHAYMKRYKMHGMGFNGQVGMWRFLAWHRIYLKRFEAALREYDKSVYIPYWKWTDGGVPDWMKAFMPTIKDVIAQPEKKPAKKTTVTTKRNNINTPFITQSDIDDIIKKNTTYATFTKALEDGPHNKGHRILGSLMSTAISPADPMFWLHHANVDRIWARWQVSHPKEQPEIDNKYKIDENKKNMTKLQPFGVSLEQGAKPPKAHGYKYE